MSILSDQSLSHSIPSQQFNAIYTGEIQTPFKIAYKSYAGLAGSQYPNHREILSIDDLQEVLRFNHTPHIYKGDHRSIDDFQRSRCLVADIDNQHTDDCSGWINIEQFSQKLQEIEHIIVPSKSHMIQKKDRCARPRFHIYLPLKDFVDPEEFDNLNAILKEQFPNNNGESHLDPAVSGRSSSFVGVSSIPDPIYHRGSLNFDYWVIQNGITQKNLPKNQKKRIQDRKTKTSISLSSPILDYFSELGAIVSDINPNGTVNLKSPLERSSAGGYFINVDDPFFVHHPNANKPSVPVQDWIKDHYPRDNIPSIITPSKNFISPTEGQEKLERLLVNWIRDQNNLAISATAGLGKSSLVRKVVCKDALDSGKRIGISVPTHALSEEFKEDLIREFPEYKDRIFVLKGRGQDDMCQINNVATISHNLAAKRISVYRSLCNNRQEICPHFHNCKYIQQFQNHPRSGYIVIFPHTYLSTSVENEDIKMPRIDSLIIDESFSSEFKEVLHLDIDAIERFRNEKTEIHSIPRKTLNNIINAIKEDRSITRALKDNVIKTDLLLTKIFVAENSASCFSKSLSPSDNNKLMRSESLAVNHDLTAFIDSVIKDFDRGKDLSVSSKNGVVKIRRRKGFDKHPYRSTPTLIIDASAKEGMLEFINACLSKIFDHIDLPVRQNAEIIQINKSFSLKTLESTEEQDQIRNIIEKESQSNGSILVTSPKKYRKQWEGISDNVSIEHFGDLRGSDKYKDHDTLISIGWHLPPISAIEDEATALLYDHVEIDLDIGHTDWDWERRIPNCKDSSKLLTVNNLCHPDAHINEILRQYLHEEISQSISRLRLIWNQKRKKIILLTNVVIDAIEIDRFETWTEQKRYGGERLLEAFKRLDWDNDILILQSSWMNKRFPDLFPGPNSFREYKSRNDGDLLIADAYREYIRFCNQKNQNPIKILKYSAKEGSKQGRFSNTVFSTMDEGTTTKMLISEMGWGSVNYVKKPTISDPQTVISVESGPVKVGIRTTSSEICSIPRAMYMPSFTLIEIDELKLEDLPGFIYDVSQDKNIETRE